MAETHAVVNEELVTKLAEAVQGIVYDYQDQTGIISIGTMEEEVKILILPLLSDALRTNGPTCHKCGKLVETGDVLCSEHEQELFRVLLAKESGRIIEALEKRQTDDERATEFFDCDYLDKQDARAWLAANFTHLRKEARRETLEELAKECCPACRDEAPFIWSDGDMRWCHPRGNSPLFFCQAPVGVRRRLAELRALAQGAGT